MSVKLSGIIKKVIIFFIAIAVATVVKTYFQEQRQKVKHEEFVSTMKEALSNCGGKAGQYFEKDGLTLTKCSYDEYGNIAIYEYKTDLKYNELEVDLSTINSLKKTMISSLLARNGTRKLIEDGLKYSYRYYSNDDRLLFTVIIDKKDL
ncbi:hypothetical protein AWD72_000026 [Escherichia coli]